MKTILDVVGAVKTYTDNKISLDPKEITANYSDIISITDAFPKAAKDVKLKVDAVQDLHGYDNPWVGGAGKNYALGIDLSAWPNNQRVEKGITYKLLRDNAGNIIGINMNGATTNNYSQISLGQINLEANVQYYMDKGNYSNTSVLFYINLGASSGSANCTSAPVTPTYNAAASNVNILLFVPANTTVSNYTITPLICKNSESDKSFAPYTNICPISGWDNAKVTRSGKNLLPLTVSRIKALNTSGTWNGNVYTYYGVTATINTDSNGNVTGIKCQGTSSNDACYVYLTDDSTLTFNDYKGMKLSGCNNGALHKYDLRVVYRNSNGAWLTSDEETTTAITIRDNVPNTAYYQIIIVVRNGKAVNETFYPMISKEGGDFEPYQGEELTISLNGTRYGGTLDVTSGVLTVDKGFAEFDGSEDESISFYNSRNGFQFGGLTGMSSASFVEGLCNQAEIVTSVTQHGMRYTDTVAYWLYAQDDLGITTVEELKTYLSSHPLQMLYMLATPQTIQLTPTEVKLLQGYNTLYADSGDISLTYNPATLGNVVEEVGELEDDVQDLENYVTETGVKNFCPTFPASVSVAGVAYTTASNGIVSAVGISTGQTAGFFAANQVANLLPAGDYILSAGNDASEDLRLVVLIKRANNSSIYIECTSAQEKPFTVYADDQFMSIYIRTNGGDKAINGTIAPMIRPASITDPTYQPYAKTNVELTQDGKALTVKLEDLVKGGNKISAKPVISTRKTWLTKTWSGLTEIHGNDVWTDGDNIYYSFGSNQYVLNKSTSTWSTKTWSGLTSFNGTRIWTDGDNIYYSYNAKQYVLDKETSTWSTKTWSGLTSFDGSYIWTDGDNIYYSNDSNQYVLDKETSNWSTKTWSGLNPSRGDDTWTDGDNIYYSYNAGHYVLDKATSTWSAKTWSGLTEFHGNNVWTDGDNIYYSASTYQYVLDKSTSNWSTKTWSGLTSFNGTSVWTDGDNIYNSASTYQYILCEKIKSIKPALK